MITLIPKALQGGKGKQMKDSTPVARELTPEEVAEKLKTAPPPDSSTEPDAMPTPFSNAAKVKAAKEREQA